MKKLLSLIAILFVLCGAAQAVIDPGEPKDTDLRGRLLGKYGDAYQVWVGTTAYQIISEALAETYTDWLIINRSTSTVWYDFDSTVSTGTTLGADVNGYETGANASLKYTEMISPGGMVADDVYFRCDDLAGVYLDVILFKRYE